MVEGTASESVARSAARLRRPVQTAVPIAAGIVSAVLIGADGGIPSVLMVCAAIYLFSAAIGRRGAAWWVFAGAVVVLIGMTAAFEREGPALLVFGVAQVVAVVVGCVRGRWSQRHNVFQLLGAVGFGVLAVAAAAGTPTLASVIAIVGLIAHTIWDLVYHRMGFVVARSYSAFCAGLDVALAVAVALAVVADT